MELIIYHTNDVHSHLEEFSKISTIIKKNKTDNDLLLDAGDFHDFMRLEMTGTDGSAGKHLLEALNYDAITIGNNESFAGAEVLKIMATTGSIPMLSCNIYLKNMTPLKDINKSIILNKNNLKILVLGATPVVNEFLELEGLYATDPIEEIKKEMKNNIGKYDLCILLSHLGYEKDCSIAEMNLGIDVIIGGHSHTEMEEAIKIKNTIIHQSGKYGELLGKLILNIDENKINSFIGENIKTESYEQDEEIIKLILEEKRTAKENLSIPLFSINETIWHDVVMENPLTNLICDSLYKYYPCDLAIMNSGIASCGISGDVTILKLLQMSPSPLNPTYMTIQGYNLKKALEETLDGELCLTSGRGSGFRGKYLGRLHVSKNLLIKVHPDKLEVYINKELLDENKEYIVMTSDYLQRGTGYNSLLSKKNIEYKAEYIRDVLRRSLNDKELILSCFENRFIYI